MTVAARRTTFATRQAVDERSVPVAEKMTISEAARRAGCHNETIRRAVRSGELPAHQDRLKSGHPYMITVDDLERFIEARRS